MFLVHRKEDEAEEEEDTDTEWLQPPQKQEKQEKHGFLSEIAYRDLQLAKKHWFSQCLLLIEN